MPASVTTDTFNKGI